MLISVYENHVDKNRARDFLGLLEESDPFTAEDEDPKPFTQSDDMGPGDAQGETISKVSFDELKKSLPDLSTSTQGTILKLVKELSDEVKALKLELEKQKK